MSDSRAIILPNDTREDEIVSSLGGYIGQEESPESGEVPWGNIRAYISPSSEIESTGADDDNELSISYSQNEFLVELELEVDSSSNSQDDEDLVSVYVPDKKDQSGSKTTVVNDEEEKESNNGDQVEVHVEDNELPGDAAKPVVSLCLGQSGNQSVLSRKTTEESEEKEPNDKNYYGYTINEVLNDGVKFIEEESAIIPENNYWAGSYYTIVIPFILQEMKFAFSLPQSPLIGPIWNYIDSLCSIFIGLNQLADDTHHRPITQKIKGLVNIMSGVSLTALTIVNFTAFGVPGFAAAFAACFVLSMDETVRFGRRLHDRNYWLKDSLSQLLKLEELIVTLEKEISELEKMKFEEQPSGFGWTLEKKKARLQQYLSTQTELHTDICARANLMAQDDQQNCLNILGDYLAKSEAPFKEDLRNSLQTNIPNVNDIENEIVRKCKVDYHSSRKETACLFIAFVGVLLLCFPPTQIAGIACISVASAYYLKKNTCKLAKSAYRFFTHSEEKEKQVEVKAEVSSSKDLQPARL